MTILLCPPLSRATIERTPRRQEHCGDTERERKQRPLAMGARVLQDASVSRVFRSVEAELDNLTLK